MVFLNGGPAHQLNPAFCFLVRCHSQQEIDSYWDKLIEGGIPMARGWLTDRIGLCWQIVPRNIGELISHPKAMEAMMGMIKMELTALEAAARAELRAFPSQIHCCEIAAGCGFAIFRPSTGNECLPLHASSLG